jgi:hypothetical protein
MGRPTVEQFEHASFIQLRVNAVLLDFDSSFRRFSFGRVR